MEINELTPKTGVEYNVEAMYLADVVSMNTLIDTLVMADKKDLSTISKQVLNRKGWWTATIVEREFVGNVQQSITLTKHFTESTIDYAVDFKYFSFKVFEELHSNNLIHNTLNVEGAVRVELGKRVIDLILTTNTNTKK